MPKITPPLVQHPKSKDSSGLSIEESARFVSVLYNITDSQCPYLFREGSDLSSFECEKTELASNMRKNQRCPSREPPRKELSPLF